MASTPSGRLLSASDAFLHATQMELFDHFERVNSLDGWNTIETDNNASVTISASSNSGVCRLDADTDANEECYLYSNELFKFNHDRQMILQTRLALLQSDSNCASVAFGLMDNIAADDIVDGGLTLRTTFTGAMLHKPFGSQNLYAETSKGSTTDRERVKLDNQFDSATDTGFVTMQIVVTPKAESFYEVVYKIADDGSSAVRQALRAADSYPVKHYVRFDPSEDLALVLGLKNVTISETSAVLVDYLGGLFQVLRIST